MNTKPKLIRASDLGTDTDLNFDFLGVKDLMDALNIGQGTAYALMRQKGFPSLRLGRKYVVERKKLREWLNAQSAHSAYKRRRSYL